MKKIIGLLTGVLFSLIVVNSTYAARESNIPFITESSDGQSTANLLDRDRKTSTAFGKGTKLTLTSEQKIHGIYLEWDKIPSAYSITYNGRVITGGQNGFLHEFIEVADGACSVELTFKSDVSLSNMYAFAAGELPKEIQKWQPKCEKADMLFISTHSDDEILFLGGAIAEYAGNRNMDVQVLYFFDYTNAMREREHEKLDGLWTLGVKNYPDCIGYHESEAQTEDTIKSVFNESVGIIVEKIRKYKPGVCVTQDVNGEYGQIHHLYLVSSVQKAVNISADANHYPDSAGTYGVHDVPKTYIHLYPENKIKIDTRKPIDSFQGKNILEVTKEAYLMHATQHQYWFYVSDENQYSIADFGLYRTTVGEDTGNDMMENLDKIYEYDESETESETEQETESITETETEPQTINETKIQTKPDAENETDKDMKKMKIFLFCAVVIGVIALSELIVFGIRFVKNNKKKK